MASREADWDRALVCVSLNSLQVLFSDLEASQRSVFGAAVIVLLSGELRESGW